MPSTTHHELDRVVRCRYLGYYRDQCTAEAADPDGEIILCYRHLAYALQLVQRRGYTAPWLNRRTTPTMNP